MQWIRRGLGKRVRRRDGYEYLRWMGDDGSNRSENGAMRTKRRQEQRDRCSGREIQIVLQRESMTHCVGSSSKRPPSNHHLVFSSITPTTIIGCLLHISVLFAINLQLLIA